MDSRMRAIQKKKKEKEKKNGGKKKTQTNMQFKVILSEPRQKDSSYKSWPRDTNLNTVNRKQSRRGRIGVRLKPPGVIKER